MFLPASYVLVVHLCTYAFLYELQDNKVDVLIENLFDNLAVDPYLHDMENFKQQHKEYIDKQVKNFLDVFKSSTRDREKRSLHLQDLEDLVRDEKGVFKLNTIEPFNAIPAMFPRKIQLFSHGTEWYAATLEASALDEEATTFNIYSYKNKAFKKVVNLNCNGAVNIACLPRQNSVFIALVKNKTSSKLNEKSAIYEYDYKNTMERIQNIDGNQEPTAVFWEFSGNIYLAHGQFHTNTNTTNTVKTTIYKWVGRHFDIVQHLDVQYVKAITPFRIRSQQYLGIANYQDEMGNTNTYSDVYKFNMHTERFELHQRIRTQACKDIKYFEFRDDNKFHEGFLVTANSFKHSNGIKDYLAESIIYKLIDGSFIPFQSIKIAGLEHWLPIQGTKGQFVLIAACKFDGLKVYQYDGWSFVDSDVELTSEIFIGINSLVSQEINESTILVTSNGLSNGIKANMFKLIFTHKNEMSEFQKDMLKWCLDTNKRLDRLEKLAKNVSKLYNDKTASQRFLIHEAQTQASMLKARQAASQTSKVNTLLLKPTKDQKMRKLLDDLNKYRELLDVVEKKIRNPLKPPDAVSIERDLSADNVVVNGDAFFTSLHTSKINDIQVNDLMDNVIDIHEELEIDGTLNFEFTRITDDQMKPKTLNTHPIEDIVHNKDMDGLELVIKGDVKIEENLLVDGVVNNITIDKKNVLLRDEDQNFEEAGIQNIQINNLDVKTINNFEMKDGMCHKIEMLNTTNLFVDSFINGINFPILNKNILHVSGDQNITATYTFENLETTNVNVELLNEQYKPSDIINIAKKEHWQFDANINFVNHLYAENLSVISRINNIKVLDGKLDIILKENKEPQQITGFKQFDNLTLLNPVLLNGPIQGPEISKLNPVTSIDRDIQIMKDITIEGDVTIEDLLKTKDIITEDDTYSMKRLLQSGLRLDEKHIPITLNFSQQINIAEIIADKINGIDVDTWIRNGDDTQIIKGLKTFSGNLSVNGPTSVSRINTIDVKDLKQNVLTVNEDQVILGKHTMKHMVTNRIKANKITHVGNELKNLVQQQAIISVNNTITIPRLKAKNCSCQYMTVSGLVNGKVFTQMVEQTFTKEKMNGIIDSHKMFKKLRCQQVETKTQDPEEIFLSKDTDLSKEEIVIDSKLILNKPINIDSIIFSEKFNGKSTNEFSKIVDKKQIILHGNHLLKTLTVIGEVFVHSGYLNNVKINSLIEDTMKVDEPLKFENLKITGTLTVPKLTLKGQIEGLDLNNTVLPMSNEVQKISGEKVFLNDVIVRGHVSFNGKINNMEETKFFSSVSPNLEKDKVLIEGNVVFPKGPRVEVLNGHPLEDLSKRVWLRNEAPTFTGKMKFEDVKFKTNISVEGKFGTLNLSSFEKNYFSKSKNQSLHGNMEFGDVMFKNNVSTPYIDLHGRLNGIKLGEFTQTVLLQDVDQTFEEIVFIENCEVKDVKGDYTINGLNIKEEVMRYDVTNIITGMKNISYLEVHDLLVDRDIRVQNVYILDFMKKAVFKDSANQITGDKIFTNAVKISGYLSIDGTLNGIQFDSKNILLKNAPQTVTGKKTFVATRLDPTEFKSVKLKGQVNGVLLQDVINIQANKDEDNMFKGKINFNKNISTQNLNVMQMYQGVNVTELLTNLTTLEILNDHENIYNNLLKKAEVLYTSLKDQAYYLHHYKLVGSFENVDVIPISYKNQIDALLTFKNESDTAEVHFYEWNENNNMYAPTNKTHRLEYYPTYVTKMRMYDQDCLYVEYPAKSGIGEQQDFPYTGEMIFIDGNRNFETYAHIPTNGTNYLSITILPGYRENCLIYTYITDNFIHIMCDNVQKKFSTYQSFLSEGVTQVTTVSHNDIPHIIIINGGSQLDRIENTIKVWKFSSTTRLFHPSQTIHERFPVFVDAINHNGNTYLAIASGYDEKSIHAGAIHIRKYSQLSDSFEPWQVLALEAPVEVKFAVLPSDELILYATTTNPSRPLVVYMYEGISRFVQKIIASAIEKAEFVRHTTNHANQHFVMTGNGKEVNVIRAVFKGKKWNFK